MISLVSLAPTSTAYKLTTDISVQLIYELEVSIYMYSLVLQWVQAILYV